MSRLLLELSFWLSRSNPKSELLVVIIIAVVGAIVVWLFNNIASRASWMFSRKIGSIPKRPFPNIIDQAPVRLNVCPVYPVLSAIQQDRHWGTARFCYRNQCELNLQTMISNMVTSILSVRDFFSCVFKTFSWTSFFLTFWRLGAKKVDFVYCDDILKLSDNSTPMSHVTRIPHPEAF